MYFGFNPVHDLLASYRMARTGEQSQPMVPTVVVSSGTPRSPSGSFSRPSAPASPVSRPARPAVGAKARFEQLMSQQLEKGLTRPAAVKAVFKANPGLQQQLIAEANR